REYIQSAGRWAGENLPGTEASGDLVERRRGPVLGRHARPADMDEPRDALVLLEAERSEHAAVIRVPLGDPGRAIAERVRGEHEAHGGGARRQHLLPFRELHMRPGAAEHPHAEARAGDGFVRLQRARAWPADIWHKTRRRSPRRRLASLPPRTR